MKSIIVAYDQNRVIGRENSLPWAGQLPDDMDHFREETHNTTVIMGRKTFESLPESVRPLPDRQNIILSLGEYSVRGVQIAHSLDEAFALAEYEEVNVIGGAQIYSLALPSVDRVVATEIETEVKDGDAYFPSLSDDEWTLFDYESFEKDGRNTLNFAFATYLRKHLLER